MTMLLLFIAGWTCWCALWWWLLAASEQPQPAAAGDPYASEVARFRRELHDWEREGRP